MLEIKVNVEIPGLPEAINNLARAIGGKTEQDSAPRPASSEPVREHPTESGEPTKPTKQEPIPTEPTPSSPEIPLDEIGRAGAALCEQGRTPELLELLKRYGVQAVMQLRDKPAETRIAFAADLRALGAAI